MALTFRFQYAPNIPVAMAKLEGMLANSDALATLIAFTLWSAITA
jgi:hypothetical protein